MSSILVLLALPVVLLFAWFVLEYARIARYTTRAKTAADAIALAAAARCADGWEVARNDASVVAAANRGPNGVLTLVVDDGPGGGGDLEFGEWDEVARSFAPNPTEGGSAVRVTVRFAPDHPNGALAPVLGGLFGISPISIERSSVAVYRPPTNTTSLLLSEAAGSSLSLSGTASIRGRGGIGHPGAGPASLAVGASAFLDVPVVRFAGTADPGVASRVSGSIQEGATIPGDPFASSGQPAIVVGAGEAIVLDSDLVHVAPGQHAALVASSGTIVLDPGLHQFEGGISLSGSASLQLANATVQLAQGAPLSISGTASLRGTCQSGVAQWNGFAVIQQAGPSNWSIQGAGSIEVDGVLLSPGASVHASDSANLRARSAVVHSVLLQDGSRLRLTSDIPEVALPTEPGRARVVK